MVSLKSINSATWHYSNFNRSCRNREPKYYRHTIFNEWEITEKTKNEWYNFLTPIYSEADGTLTICRNTDFIDFIHDALPKLVIAGAIMYGGIVAIGELALIQRGISAYGVWNTLTMYNAENYGESVVYIVNSKDLSGVVLSEGMCYSVLEKEVIVELLPSEFAKLPNITLTTADSRGILQSMGISLPNIISKSQITDILKNTPALSNEQIIDYYKRVLELKGIK